MDESTLRESLAARVGEGPDEHEASTRLYRYLAAADPHEGGLAACVPDETAADLLVLLLGQSPFFSRELVRAPASVAALARDPFLRAEKPEPVFQAERAAACCNAQTAASDLRAFRDREYLRLAARELGYGRADEVGRELSALAAACLDGAIAFARAELDARHGTPLVEPDDGGPARRCRFVVLGMGKLGGRELNFSSDIDLVYLYESDVGRAGDLSLHEHHARLAERVTRLLTAEGAFRVDLRLRPEGARGPLVNSLPAAERYYESWARPWERQAFIKARPVAGDRDLGDEALALLEPFVWPRSGVATAIDDVQSMMRKVRAELRDAEDVKLGPGGIREIEFFVQALQRVHGGRRRELRERGTLAALDRLLFGGLVSEREHRALGDAYVFLRRLEHRVQLEELRQTHALPPPDDDARRATLARRLGFPDRASFEERLAAHRADVSAIYGTLGRDDAGPPAPVLTLLDRTGDRAAIEPALRALGFGDAAASADELELLRTKPHSPLSPVAVGASARAAPLLLAEVAASPDPDLALRRLVDLATRGAPSEIVWRLCGESPAIARLLASLFGTSELLSKILIARPILVEQLLTTAGDGPRRDRAAHRAALAERLAALGPPRDGDEEDRLDLLRRYQKDELLAIGLRDVGGDLSVEDVAGELTDLADALLEATLAVVAPGVFRRYGEPRTGFAVLGLGKLGGRELGWSSDLDLVFVFGDDDAGVIRAGSVAPDARPFEVMSRLAQALLSGLGAYLGAGRLYEVDTRLRPSGQQGALVTSVDGFRRYHRDHAALWERQTLIKARFVAGDATVGAAAEAIAARHVWEGPTLDAGAAAREIARLRRRMEDDLSRARPGRVDLKQGRGGLVDVEFVTQYLQLVHGPARPSLRARATLPALEALRAEGLLDEESFAALSVGYRFLRRLDSRLRLVHDRPSSTVSEDPVALDKLARRLGLHGHVERTAGRALLDELLARTAAIRGACARHLPLEPSPPPAAP